MDIYKIIIIGDSSTGKTSLLKRYVDNEFEDTISTIGVDFRIKTENDVKLQLWTTCGQERFRAFSRSYYRNADAAIILYDITNKESFEHLLSWLEEAEVYSHINVLKVLVGSKLDCNKIRVVDYADAVSFANKHDMIYIECSAKHNINIDSIFKHIYYQLKDRKKVENLINKSDQNIRVASLQLADEQEEHCCN
jgi:small GTP-binding protein